MWFGILLVAVAVAVLWATSSGRFETACRSCIRWLASSRDA